MSIYFYQFNLFWDCVNDFVNIFNVLLNFNPTKNFKEFLSFRCSFVGVNGDVSFDSDCNFIELKNDLNLK